MDAKDKPRTEKPDVRRIAEELISTEAACIEWGATTEQSVALATETLQDVYQRGVLAGKAEAEANLATLRQRVERLEGILRGDTREETAEKLFAASKGAMNTRSVYILADEIWAQRRATEGQEEGKTDGSL